VTGSKRPFDADVAARKRASVRNKLIAQERRAKGFCVLCGVDAYGLPTCGECAAAHRTSQRRRRAREAGK
jgi:hypothetical protein